MFDCDLELTPQSFLPRTQSEHGSERSIVVLYYEVFHRVLQRILMKGESLPG